MKDFDFICDRDAQEVQKKDQTREVPQNWRVLFPSFPHDLRKFLQQKKRTDAEKLRAEINEQK